MVGATSYYCVGPEFEILCASTEGENKQIKIEFGSGHVAIEAIPTHFRL